MTVDGPTVAVSTALVVITLSIVLSATWRALTTWVTTFTWTPRITPGIRAEVHLVMTEQGHVNIMIEKLAPEDDVSRVFSLLLDQLFATGEQMGVTVNWSSKIGAVVETPEGPEYVVALMRPAKPHVREITHLETQAMGAGPIATPETKA